MPKPCARPTRTERSLRACGLTGTTQIWQPGETVGGEVGQGHDTFFSHVFMATLRQKDSCLA